MSAPISPDQQVVMTALKNLLGEIDVNGVRMMYDIEKHVIFFEVEDWQSQPLLADFKLAVNESDHGIIGSGIQRDLKTGMRLVVFSNGSLLATGKENPNMFCVVSSLGKLPSIWPKTLQVSINELPRHKQTIDTSEEEAWLAKAYKRDGSRENFIDTLTVRGYFDSISGDSMNIHTTFRDSDGNVDGYGTYLFMSRLVNDNRINVVIDTATGDFDINGS